MSSSPLGLWLLFVALVGTFASVSAWDHAGRPHDAPSFTLRSTGYESGTEGAPVEFSLADYAGKTVVLDMMAVECASCKIVTREVLTPLQEKFGTRDDFAILSIDTWADPGTGNSFGGETDATLIRLQKTSGVPWRHALDTDRVWQKYAAVALPRLVVVDGDGRVVYSRSGVPDFGKIEDAVTASLAQDASPVPILYLGLPALAVVAGAASFFTPCSVGLLPAYLARLIDEGKGHRAARVMAGGIAASLGIVAIYGGLAVLFALAGGSVRRLLPFLAPVVGVAFIAVGALSLSGRSIPFLDRVARPDARRSFASFGVAYGLAGFACTGPLFLPILVAGFLDGVTTGLLLFLLYAIAVAALVLLAAALVAWGQETRLRRVLAHSNAIQKASAVLMVAAGLYLLWYNARARGWFG